MIPLADAAFGLTNDVIRTIGSAATAVGVSVALLGGAWRRWWTDPLLILEHDGLQAGPNWDIVHLPGQAFFVRARVRNARGSTVARDVQIVVTDFRSGALGLNGRALEWSGQRERHGIPVTLIDIPAGISRHVDVVQVSPRAVAAVGAVGAQTGSALSPISYEARLCVAPKPWGASHVLAPTDDIELTVVITASNADAISYSMRVKHSGDMIAEVSCLPRVVDPPMRYRFRSAVKRR